MQAKTWQNKQTNKHKKINNKHKNKINKKNDDNWQKEKKMRINSMMCHLI